MARLIAGVEFAFVPACRGYIQDPDLHPSLDPDLRLLIQRCLAVDPQNRPRLEELIPSLVKDLRTEDYYKSRTGYDSMESDMTVRMIAARFILNADT